MTNLPPGRPDPAAIPRFCLAVESPMSGEADAVRARVKCRVFP